MKIYNDSDAARRFCTIGALLVARQNGKFSRIKSFLRHSGPITKAQLRGEERAVYDAIKRSSLFDGDFYLQRNHDVLAAKHDPLAHYIVCGVKEGRDPSVDFDTSYYLDTNSDVLESKINPLYHYICFGIREARSAKPITSRDQLDHSARSVYNLIEASGLFDRDYYLSRYADVGTEVLDPLAHYINYGALELRDPSREFSTGYYVSTYEDVAKSNINPLLHYVLYGAKENRSTRSPSSATAGADAFPAISDRILSAIERQEVAEIRASGLFDEAWYYSRHPEIDAGDPAQHFYEFGAIRRTDPSAFFDSAAYLAANSDVAASGINPLLHWLRHGRFEGRDAPVRQQEHPRPSLTLRELCDPERDETWHSDPIDLRFSILTPTYNTEPAWLRELYQTLRNQTYGGWEWVVGDDRSTRGDTLNVLREIAAGDPRVVLAPPSRTGHGISHATNAALERATGDYAVLVDHDDLLSRDVLAKIRDALRTGEGVVDMAYTDECKLSSDNEVYDVYLKPGWSPVLLENTMYIGHLTVYRTGLLRELGGLRPQFDGTQDFDLALRASQRAKRVVHIPTIGYLWRAVPGSTAASMHEKSYAISAQKRAVSAFATKRNVAADVEPGFALGYWRVNYPLSSDPPRLSYVIPTAAGSRLVRGAPVDLISHCIESLERTAFYPDPEYVVVHNGDLGPEQITFLKQRPSVRLIEYRSEKFNLAEKINQGVRAATGRYVCLLNDDVEAVTPRGGETLVGLMEARPEVGAVAPFCMFEDGRSQHNGVVLLEQGPSHAGIFHNPAHGGHANFLRLRREAFAVTGAMLFCRRDLYLELGGFDEGFPLNYNDVDFCLRLRAAGFSCVVDPDVRVYHFESASKTGTFRCEKERLFARWPGLSDPYFNPGLDQRDPAFALAQPHAEPRPFRDPIVFERWLDRCIGRGRGATNGSVTFSVCVPIYNQPRNFLNEMLASVQMQTWPHKELILVDDASTLAETRLWLDRLQSQPGLKLVRLPKNQGIVGAQRHFLEHASGDFIIPLDADDFLTIDALAILAAAVASHPDADVFYSDEFKSNPSSEKFAPFFKTDFDPVMIGNRCFTCHAMALRTSVMRDLDGYGDRRATWCHDWDSTFRALASGREPIHVPEQIYAWRISPGSTASVETGMKPEAAASQRFVLERAITQRGLSNRLSVRPNPVWPHSSMWSLEAIAPVPDVTVLGAEAAWRADDPAAVLGEAAGGIGAWIAILLDTDEAAAHDALLKLSAVALWEERVGVVSGALSQRQDERVLWAGGVFTEKGVIDPFAGVPWYDGGYYGRLFGQRCVDVAAPVNVMIRSEHLREALAWLGNHGWTVTPASLMVALGRLAARDRWFIAVTPLLRADIPADARAYVPVDRDGIALSGTEPILVSRWYGAHLDPERPFLPVSARAG